MTATETPDPTPAPQGASTPQEIARSLGVQLSKQLMPDFRNTVPNRFVPLEEAQRLGISMYWSGESCRYGHQAARYVSNPRRCVDCERVKRGEAPIYPKSRAQTFYSAEHAAKIRDAKLGVAPVAAIQQQPAAPREPSKKEQSFLEALALTADFDAAARSAGMSRGAVEARASVDSVFKAALADLCERLSIAWTNPAAAGDAARAFTWTDAIEKKLIRRYIDSGLIESARQELGISGSDYQDRLIENPDFAAAIEAARVPARETLRERALQAADRGNDRLLKALEDEADENFTRLPDGTKVRRLGDPATLRAEMEDLLNTLRKSFGSRERLREACVARTAERPQPNRNSDLIQETAT